LGPTRKTLYAMRDAGILEQLARGTYRLKDLPPLGNPDLVIVAKRVPQGIAVHELDGVPVRIYSAEKTLADCFKFRHKLGMDVVLEALWLWRERRGRDVESMGPTF